MNRFLSKCTEEMEEIVNSYVITEYKKITNKNSMIYIISVKIQLSYALYLWQNVTFL